jgi:glucose/arabinose dehydrogenase
MPAAPALTLPSGFKIEVIASIPAPRELVSLPNGDLLVGTTGTDVWLVPNADASGAADAPVVFATVNDAPVQGVAFLADTCTVAIGSQHGIYSVAYRDGQTHATPGAPVTSLRTGPIAHSVDPSDDTDTHVTTSLGFAGGKLYASVGSSCNACAEVDPSRALVWTMNPDGSEKTQRAKNIRNVIAVATNPATGTVWLGGAGQDDLALGHPYEYFDALTVHPGEADYGWPSCEENQHAYVAGADCSGTVIPLIELPAYSTLIGATFYPTNQGGAYALPATYGGGLFVTAHGSWHRNTDNTFYSPPRVAYVAMNGDAPKVPADWSNPSAQWVEFIGGFQLSTGKARVGKPTGIAVGVQGSLFIADDQNGYVYRVRPG